MLSQNLKKIQGEGRRMGEREKGRAGERKFHYGLRLYLQETFNLLSY